MESRQLTMIPVNQDLCKAGVTVCGLLAGCYLVTQGARDVGAMIASTALGGYLGNITAPLATHRKQA